MRSLGVLTVLLALTASPLAAQGRSNRNGNAQGIPAGHMPPAGMCRVWYDGVPPGRQPRPTSCNDAERLASRDRNARVIYGGDSYRSNRNYPYGNDRYGSNDRYGYNSVAYDNGYRDGLEKGREDAGDRDSYDPVRHSWYRNGNRGYNDRSGTRDQYKLVYRDGFEAGYAQGYRAAGGRYNSSRSGGIQSRWPF
jgi:hypothetical protein